MLSKMEMQLVRSTPGREIRVTGLQTRSPSLLISYSNMMKDLERYYEMLKVEG